MMQRFDGWNLGLLRMGQRVIALRPFFMPLVVAVGLCGAGCASNPRLSSGAIAVPTATGRGALALPDGTTPAGAYEAVSDYRIGAHDLLKVTVFQVEEMSPSVRVNSRGMISLPLIGAVQAGGKTVDELEAEITARLAKDLIQDPQVSVFIEEYTSQRVTVEGSVKKPGIFPITGRTSLLQSIALSEGLDPLADPQRVVIFRVIDGKKMAAMYDLTAIREGSVGDPLLYGDDIVVVDSSGGKTLLKSITDTLRGFIGFRAY